MNHPFLHCHHLAFPQPETGAIIDITCPLSEDLQEQLKALGFPEENI